MNSARQRRFVRVMALVVVLGAILPQITYLGHWSIRGLSASAAAGDDGHANHCHGSPSCADQAAYGFQWVSEASDAVTLDGDPLRAEPWERDGAPVDAFVTPPERPPQYA